jgi:hypothetical protein
MPTEAKRVTVRFADGRFMILSLELTEEQARVIPSVVYLDDREGEEVLALLEAWFPSAFAPGAAQRAGSTLMGNWWAGPRGEF